MVATTALLVGGGLATIAALVAVNASAKEKGRGKNPANVSPFLFETGPDGTVAFKPAISAGFMNTALGVSAFEFPEQGNDDLILLTKTAVAPESVARTWVVQKNVNENMSILAVRHITVPTAPPPDGPMRLMMAVPPGQENLHTKGNSLWAVFALAGTLAPGAGAPDPGIPPGGAIPEPGEVLPPGHPDFPGAPPGELPDLPDIVPVQPGPGGGLPPGLQAEFDRVMTDPTITPEELRAVAAILEAAGFPAEAQALRTKAAAIEAQQAIIEAAPRQILIGGNAQPLPGAVAQHYTGDFKRFKELADPVNPGVHVVPVPGMPGQFGLSPWAGETITIPNNWPLKNSVPKGALPVGSNPFNQGGGQGVPPGGDVDLGNPFGALEGVADSFGEFDDFFDPNNEVVV